MRRRAHVDGGKLLEPGGHDGELRRLEAALRHRKPGGLLPGGVVVYQTYTVHQPRFGSPKSPDHLLREGELLETFAGWEVLNYREFTGRSRATGKLRSIAGIVARKPPAG